MNRIVLKNNLITLSEIDDKIELKEPRSLVSTFKIIFKESTELEIKYDTDSETKLNFEFDLSENINVNIYEIRKGLKTKVQYKYNIKRDSKLYLYRLNNSEFMREVDLVDLKGENSSIDFNLKTLSTNQEKYDIYVSHNNRNTTSVVNNIGIALKGGVTFNVTGEVLKGNSGSYLDQNNQIVTFDQNKCQINPNLLIEEFDVEANHNAKIGEFDSEQLFYLMSRGITYQDSIKLLSEGLIMDGLKETYPKEEILNYIKEYWG